MKKGHYTEEQIVSILREAEAGTVVATARKRGVAEQTIYRWRKASEVPYLAIESDADRALKGRQAGFSVFYGDASQVDVLKAAGAGQAGVLVCTLDNAVPAIRLVSILRQHYPDIGIFARGHDRLHCDELLKAGATIAISETLEASLQLGGAVLNTMGVFEDEATTLTNSFRKEYYK